MESIIFNPETEANFIRLKRFLSEGVGYTFATATDQRLIPELNKKLQTELPNTRILFFVENDIPYIEQIRQVAETCQALIIMDIGELIRKNENFIYTLNFAREEINGIGKPILFWVSNSTLTKIANQANDLYSQRFNTNLHFEQKLPAAALDKSFDELINTFEPDSEKQNRLSSIKVLEHQLAAHQGEKSAIAKNIALPLAKKYAEDGQRDQAMSILNEFDGYLNKTNAYVLFDIAKINELTYNTSEAIKYYEKALHYSESEEMKATIYNEIGIVCQDRGDLDNAIDYLTKALAINIKLFGTENPDSATYHNNIGIAWHDKGNLDQAINYLTKALAIDKKLFGTENQRVAKLYNNLGSAWQAIGNSDKGFDYITKALAINIKLFGEEDPNVAICYNNLGTAWQAKGNLDQAIDFYTKALNIDIKLFGEENPSVSIRYNNLGGVWQDKGNLDQAIDFYTKALNIDIKLFGKENPNVARDYNNIGSAWQEKDDLYQAIDFYTKSLTINVKLLGAENPNVAIDYNNLGTAWKAKGDLDKAIDYYNKSYHIFLKQYGADNPSTKTVKANLDACLAAMKK